MIQFDVALPWENTPPSKLALPWTPIPPAAITATIAIVRLNSQSILVAVNRAVYRSAFIVTGIVDFRIQLNEGRGSADHVLVTCPDGTEEHVGFFAAWETWNATQHPSTYTLRSIGEPTNPCSTLSNTD